MTIKSGIVVNISESHFYSILIKSFKTYYVSIIAFRYLAIKKNGNSSNGTLQVFELRKHSGDSRRTEN